MTDEFCLSFMLFIKVCCCCFFLRLFVLEMLPFITVLPLHAALIRFQEKLFGIACSIRWYYCGVVLVLW